MVGIKDFDMPNCCNICEMSSCKGWGNFYCDITLEEVDMDSDKRDADCPLVEAIPKDQYEARLKADMLAILTEIQLELDEMKITKVRSAGFAPYSKDPFRRGVNCSKEIIQQKINSLKENEDDKI